MKKKKTKFNYSEKQVKRFDKFSDKQLNLFSILLICLAVLLILLNITATIIIGIFVLIFGIYCRGILKNRKKSEAVKTDSEVKIIKNENIKKSAPEPPKTENTVSKNLLPIKYGDFFLKYSSEEQICFINADKNKKIYDVLGQENQQITFEFEEDNEFDPLAVKIMLNDRHLGYVYRGQVQEMLHRFFNKNWEVCAHITKYSLKECKAYYRIGFYKPISQAKIVKYNLIGITKECRENLEYLSDGQQVTIEYDEFNDLYEVYSDGCKVGRLHKKFTDEHGPDKMFSGYLTEVETDDEYSAIVNVYE